MTTAETLPDALGDAEHPIEHVHVVVPVRDEEQQLPRHLGALGLARDVLVAAEPATNVTVHLVLDSCVDGSAAIVARDDWVDATAVDLGTVGATRAAGVERAAAQSSTSLPERVWIACTDADTAVPPDWLVGHLSLARSGAQYVTGTVHPDPGDLEHGRLAAWWSRHHLRDGHDYVHGANLGFTLAAYRAVGGFAPLASGEDVDLVRRLRAAELHGLGTASYPVLTSGRQHGRAPAGFAAYLLQLPC